MLPKTKNKPEIPAVKPVKVEISTGVSETVRSEILKAFPLIKQNAMDAVKNAIGCPITEQQAFENVKLTEVLILSLKPSDIVIFKVEQRLSESTTAKLHAQIRSFVPNNKIVILEPEFDIEILRTENI